MRYAVDLTRGIYYAGLPEYNQVVLLNPFINLVIMILGFTLFLVVGTLIFVRKEKNR
jgi:ABC-2 type transport system permease protein